MSKTVFFDASFYTGSKSDDYTEIEQAVGKD